MSITPHMRTERPESDRTRATPNNTQRAVPNAVTVRRKCASPGIPSRFSMLVAPRRPGQRREQLLEARGVERLAEEVALPLFAAQGEEALELGFLLDAFGGDGDVEGLRHRGDGAHDRLIGGMRLDLTQERAVDLQLLDRQQAQVGKARI